MRNWCRWFHKDDSTLLFRVKVRFWAYCILLGNTVVCLEIFHCLCKHLYASSIYKGISLTLTTYTNLQLKHWSVVLLGNCIVIADEMVSETWCIFWLKALIARGNTQGCIPYNVVHSVNIILHCISPRVHCIILGFVTNPVSPKFWNIAVITI